MNVERIYRDEDFWEVNVVKAKAFFERAILPELIGKFYSRINTQEENQTCSSLVGPQNFVVLNIHENSEEALDISEYPTEILDVSETQVMECKYVILSRF